ncbi:hypothetical protein [Desulfoscipio geothermicus]|uniref:Uncharacterized protein n=1 Tax=Desulfoscipio geothermicus DSM 3669 TaxID=1121426 RepID=A0A1I6E3F0_9FIRM|nr:hypothetical protein [Desulfoscipio geothermicus]SFR12300.1 hypothetical protein SAMN05660706_1252 [Desulfoscipio geothermicus DSM 3669]
MRRSPVGIIPLVPLMRHDDPPKEVLAGCAKRIEEVQPELQPDLYLGLAIFSSIRFSRDLVLRYIEVSKMKNSPLFGGIREKWIGQGEQKGVKRKTWKSS